MGYTEKSDEDGGWYIGDMRQKTGKILLSHGIDMANYGISSSSGSDPDAHPFTCALLAAHNTVGMYQNGRKVHGGSGGNGIMTVGSGPGNEWSHEAGHNYGMRHYPDGFKGSVHRSAESVGSTWGWDSDVNVFIPNFSEDESGEDMCCCETTNTVQCESPFLGKYQYGKDAMAGGGGGKWGVNRYTLYTPNSMSKIQNFFEGKAIWDPTSWSGFRKYNPSSREMEEFVNPNKGKVPRLFRVPVTTIVGYYDPELKMDNKDYIFPALHGAFGFVYNDDVAKSSTNGCELRVQTNNAGTRVFKLLTKRETSDTMNKFHVNIAAEEMASAAEVYCYGQQLVSKQLEGLKEDLKFTVHGVSFDVTTPKPTSAPTVAPTKPPSDSPTSVPTVAPTKPPIDSPTASPSISSCITCDDVPPGTMKRNNKICAGSNSVQTKCNKSAKWTNKKFCRLSCFNAGNGYEGDLCCNGSII